MKASELRASILQEAVSGRLVPQDPAEGTAEELLIEIAKERDALIKAGKIKKEKPLTEITEDKIPFEIPKTWKWVRLTEICIEFLVPQRDKPKVFSGNIPWCRIEDISGKYLYGTKSNQYVSQETVDEMNLRINPVGTVLCSCSASLGVAAIVKKPCCINQTFIGLVLNSHVFNEYLYYILIQYGDLFRKMGTGTTIPYISKDKFKKMLIPLPPLAEQKRIVAKIEELNPLIDTYGEEEELLLMISSKFPEDIRASILQEAVSGRLVLQDPSEGTAEDLLMEIAKERDALIKAGKIKKEKPLPEITEDEIPFEIPKTWKWVRLNQICYEIGDGIHGTPNYDKNGDCYFINGSNLDDGHISILPDTKTVSKEEAHRYKNEFYENTIFYSINGTIGNYAFYNDENIILGKSAAYISPLNKISKKYLVLLLKSEMMNAYANENKSQTTIGNLSLKSLREMPIPIPPLAEQKRIVSKVEELMKIVEKIQQTI